MKIRLYKGNEMRKLMSIKLIMNFCNSSLNEAKEIVCMLNIQESYPLQNSFVVEHVDIKGNEDHETFINNMEEIGWSLKILD